MFCSIAAVNTHSCGRVHATLEQSHTVWSLLCAGLREKSPSKRARGNKLNRVVARAQDRTSAASRASAAPRTSGVRKSCAPYALAPLHNLCRCNAGAPRASEQIALLRCNAFVNRSDCAGASQSVNNNRSSGGAHCTVHLLAAARSSIQASKRACSLHTRQH